MACLKPIKDTLKPTVNIMLSGVRLNAFLLKTKSVLTASNHHQIEVIARAIIR